MILRVDPSSWAATADDRDCRTRCVLVGAILLVMAVLLVSGCAVQHPTFRAVYTDLDGTALMSDHSVSSETIEALRRYRQAGGAVGIATGRSYEQARHAIEAVRPDLPVVLYNGAVTYDAQRSVFTVLDTLDSAAVGACRKALEGNQAIDGYIVHYLDTAVPSLLSEDVSAFAERSAISLSAPGSIGRGPVIKILILIGDSDPDSLRTALERELPDVARVVISSPRTVEVLNVATDKAQGVRRALVGHGLTIGDVVAFGDSGNDLELISQAGLGVVMNNGRSETLKIADVIIGSNDTAAIARFLDFLLWFEEGARR